MRVQGRGETEWSLGSRPDVRHEPANLERSLRRTAARSGVGEATAAGEPGGVISFIIPAWRDSENVSLLLPKLATLPGRIEIIVVEVSVEGRVPSRPLDPIGVRFATVFNPNRGEQMNHG